MRCCTCNLRKAEGRLTFVGAELVIIFVTIHFVCHRNTPMLFQRLVLSLGLLCATMVSAQHISYISVDTSRFPVMSARVFYANDHDQNGTGSRVTAEVHDNDAFCSSSVVPSASDLNHRASTLMLSMDISLSAYDFPAIKALTHLAVRSVVNDVNMNHTDVGLCFFDNLSHIACDYTSNRDNVLRALSTAFDGRATSYRQALTEEKTGALSLITPKTSNNMILLIADGSDSLDVEAISDRAHSLNCSICCLGIGSFPDESLRRIAQMTGGYCFTQLQDSAAVVDAAYAIAGIVNGESFFDVQWTASDIASESHRVNLNFPSVSRQLNFTYTVRDQKRARVEHTGHLIFGAVAPHSSSNAPIAVQALNFDITIDSVAFLGMPAFHTSQQFPLKIKANATADIPITYAPADSSYVWSRMMIYTRECGSSSVTMSGGYPGYEAKTKCLKILKPKANDILPTDSYVSVEWEGTPPNNFCRVELSVDDGRTWKVMQENVPGNLYMMKTPRDPHERCRLRVTQKASQTTVSTPGIQDEISDGVFSIVNPATFVNEVRMNATIVGQRKDKSFSAFIKNITQAPLFVESADITGDHPNDFHICSQAPPYTLQPGQTHDIELSFTPTAKGMRNARVSLKTSAGYATARVSGVGIDALMEVKPLIVDFGDVQMGDSVTVKVPNALFNHGDFQISLKKMFLIGPDTTQFSMYVPNTLPVLKHNEGMNLSLSFKAEKEGRISSEAVVLSDAEDAPHVLQLTANSMAHVKDPTAYREVVAPTARTMKAGSYAVGDVDGLGVLGFYGITDNIMVQAGGVIPIPLGGKSTFVYSIGVKGGMALTKEIGIAAGYQFVKSRYDNSATDGVESNVTVHAPYIVGTYGDDDARGSLAIGYAFKHHVTLVEPNGFNADAILLTLSGDVRVGARWKICGESYTFHNLGYVPIVGTLRYLGDGYTLDAGLAYIGITTGDTVAPSLPVFPVLSAIWNF